MTAEIGFPTSAAIGVRDTEPVWFRLAKRLQRAGVRGGFRLERKAAERWWPAASGVRHRLSAEVSLVVPIAARRYDRDDIDLYEEALVRYAADLLASTGQPVTLIDCGADFGMVSAKLLAACPMIERILAFEPNPEVFGFLEHNLRSWPVDGRAVPAAVADWVGGGELRQPPFDSSPHAAFVAPVTDGEIDVVTVDSLALTADGPVALKIDVEGGELAVVKGAARLLAEADDFVVLFEAHPRQSDRVGIDPTDVIRELSSLRPCRTVVTERPDLTIDEERSFLSQVGDDRIYNVCVTTIGA